MRVIRRSQSATTRSCKSGWPFTEPHLGGSRAIDTRVHTGRAPVCTWFLERKAFRGPHTDAGVLSSFAFHFLGVSCSPLPRCQTAELTCTAKWGAALSQIAIIEQSIWSIF